MTNEQKLAALRSDLVGSYNLAPLNSSATEITAFQALAREACEIADDRGYFCRRDIAVFEGGRLLSGVLVTVSRTSIAALRPRPAHETVLAATPLIVDRLNGRTPDQGHRS